MEKHYRHNPDSSQARRNRALRAGQKREITQHADQSRERAMTDLDNELDRAFSKAPKKHIATKRFQGIGPSKMFHGKG